MRKKTKPRNYAGGILFAILLTSVIYIILSLQIIPAQWIANFIDADHPRLSIWFLSIIVAFALLSAAKLGISIEIPIFKNISPAISSLISEFSWWVYASILTVTILLLFITGGPCESPTAEIHATYLDGSPLGISGQQISLKPNSKIIIKAIVQDTTFVSCNWTVNGSAVRNINPTVGCDTQVNISNDNSLAIVTLVLSNSYCAKTSTYPIEIHVVP